MLRIQIGFAPTPGLHGLREGINFARTVHCLWGPGKMGTWFLPSGLHFPNPCGRCTSSAMPFTASPNSEASSCSFLGPGEGLMRKATAFAHGYARLQRFSHMTPRILGWGRGAVIAFLTVRLLLAAPGFSSLNIQLCPSYLYTGSVTQTYLLAFLPQCNPFPHYS